MTSTHNLPNGSIGLPNVRTHATAKRVVAEHLAEEQPKLWLLPAGPFQAVLRLERRITRDGNVWVNGNLYSVQKTTRKRMVEVHGVAHEIRVLEQGQIIAVHAMMPGRGHCCITAGRHTSPTARRHGAGYRSPSGAARPSCLLPHLKLKPRDRTMQYILSLVLLDLSFGLVLRSRLSW